MCSIPSAAGEPPWPGWLGKYTLKSLASRSWNASQRPAPPAPCRNRRGGPDPSCSIWTGVPRTLSSCAAGISADEESAIWREPLPGEERAVVGREEERRRRDLVRLARAPERCAGDHRGANQRRHPPGQRRHAREVDDRAAVSLAHKPERLARAVERPVQVHREHPAPRLVGQVLGHVEVRLAA